MFAHRFTMQRAGKDALMRIEESERGRGRQNQCLLFLQCEAARTLHVCQ